MVALETLEDAARQAFLMVYQEQSADRASAGPMSDHCPVLLVLHKLLALVDEFHDRPVQELRSVICRIVREEMSVLESAHASMEPIVTAAMPSDLDEQVDWILPALEHVRQMGLEQGFWSTAPLTEQWCG